MSPTKLYAELQVNPRNQVAYRSLAEHYRGLGMTNEADAFMELIRKKFDGNGTNTDEKQQPHHRQDA